MGSNIFQGGGVNGATVVFFGRGGVMNISIETFIICDFSGVGGGSRPPIPFWIYFLILKLITYVANG